MNRRLAFTLAEVLVAGALATAILGVIVYLFVNFSRQAEQPLATMSMDQSTFGIMRWLQRDLAETNLQTIKSLPNQSGVMMESPRDLTDHLVFSPYGVVQWQKFLKYEVKPIATDRPLPEGVQLGELNYDERLLVAPEGATPEPAFPGTSTSTLTERHKELSRSFMITNNATRMGLHVYFNDSSGNPIDFSQTARGEPVCVRLSLLEVGGRTGQPTIRTLYLQVKPRN